MLTNATPICTYLCYYTYISKNWCQLSCDHYCVGAVQKNPDLDISTLSAIRKFLEDERIFDQVFQRNITVYSRICHHGSIIQSQRLIIIKHVSFTIMHFILFLRYKKVSKRNNRTVMCKDGKYGDINCFVTVQTGSGEFHLAVMQMFEIGDHSCVLADTELKHLMDKYITPVKATSAIAAVSVHHIIQRCILLSMEDVNYICVPPNKVEKE